MIEGTAQVSGGAAAAGRMDQRIRVIVHHTEALCTGAGSAGERLDGANRSKSGRFEGRAQRIEHAPQQPNFVMHGFRH